MNDHALLRVGGLTKSLTACEDAVADYLSPTSGRVWGYPHYDQYDTGSHPDRLTDGDLLAPNLLNARVLLPGYAALQRRRGEIEAALAHVPRDVRLIDATDEQIASLGPLFALVDQDDGIPHVGATTFSKLVHRKRPRLIPLWDRRVRYVYQGTPESPLWDKRSLLWGDYVIELALTMKADLEADAEAWNRLSQGKVSMLRTLDIVAWSFARPDTESDDDDEVEV